MQNRPVEQKLPPRTQAVHTTLYKMSTNGVLSQTTEELAKALCCSRQQLSKHLGRLREARLLTDLESAVSTRGGWTKAREVARPACNPCRMRKAGFSPYLSESGEIRGVTTANTYIHTYMHELPTEELRSSSGSSGRRCAAKAEVEIMGEHELTDIFTGVRNPRPFSADALPPYPGYDVLEPPSLPPMPRLLADPAAAGKLLVRAYKAACWKNYGKKPRTDKQVTFRMRHAAFAMREQGIESPYAWAAFRLHTWRLSLLAETTHPAIDYVFSRKVVEDHAEHFAGVAERYEVRRHIVLPESHQLLVVLWARARRALASPGNADKTDEEIVEGILPRERYDQLIAAAQHEGRALVADAMRRLGRGEWIW